MYKQNRSLRDLSNSLLRRAPQRCALFGASVVAVLCGTAGGKAKAEQSLAPLASNEETWKRLPVPRVGSGKTLPSWARMLAGELPRSTAALLELDLAQRTKSPVAPQLRAAMRWVSANANRCEYAQQVAAIDATAAGLDTTRLAALSRAGFPGWSEGERLALEFAHKMSVDSDAVTDDEFAGLVRHFGEHQTASMVLLSAYSNFQDRLLLCLGLTSQHERERLGPVEVAFDPEAFVVATTHPPLASATPLAKPTGKDDVEDDPEWTSISFDSLQKRLQTQREKPTRLRIPAWDEVAVKLPEGLMRRPSDIVWYRIVFGYAPELAVPYERFMRTAGAESSHKYDRIFGSSLFWVTTRSVNCAYCMGHCEMNWEVAGLSRSEIADRSRLLAGNDWSSFPPAEQRAFAFARKLARTPWAIDSQDVNVLKDDFGPDRALVVALHACRYHYMTRISNGFQLKLESENVFFDYWNMKQPTPTHSAYVPTKEEYRTLESDLGPEQAMAIFWWLCRGLYMTRISDGFQLSLERENVFQSPTSSKPNPQRPSPGSKSQ